MGRPKVYRKCYNCENVMEKKDNFKKDSPFCKKCETNGFAVPSKIVMCRCQQCNTEYFLPIAKRDQKFCSRDCYQMYLASAANPRRGAACPPSPDRQVSAADMNKTAINPALKKHTAKCKTTLKSFEEISRFCRENNLTYGQYSYLKSSGKLDAFLAQSNS